MQYVGWIVLNKTIIFNRFGGTSQRTKKKKKKKEIQEHKLEEILDNCSGT